MKGLNDDYSYKELNTVIKLIFLNLIGLGIVMDGGPGPEGGGEAHTQVVFFFFIFIQYWMIGDKETRDYQ